MTFLEYVAEQLMGPPVCGSCWRCPYCDSHHGSLSVRPPRDGYPIKFKCHKCQTWGDEHDLLKLFYPAEGYSLRLLRLGELHREYESRVEPQPLEFIPRGRGGSTKPDDDEFGEGADAAAAEIFEHFGKRPNLVEAFKDAEAVLTLCGKHGLDPVAFAKRCHFHAWVVEGEEAHMKVCEDFDCDFVCCRLARGWTLEQIKANLRREQEEKERERRKGMTPEDLRFERRKKAIRKKAERSRRYSDA